jgi:hypothetical protein
VTGAKPLDHLSCRQNQQRCEELSPPVPIAEVLYAIMTAAWSGKRGIGFAYLQEVDQRNICGYLYLKEESLWRTKVRQN